MERLLIWAGFSLVLAVLCLIRPNVGRIFVGFFFLALAVAVHIVTTLTNPASYTAWVDTIWIPIYRDLYAAWVAPIPAVFVLPIAAYEIAVAVLLLQKGQAVTLGVIGAIAFLAGIMPLGIEELGNVVLIVGYRGLGHAPAPRVPGDLPRRRTRAASPWPERVGNGATSSSG